MAGDFDDDDRADSLRDMIGACSSRRQMRDVQETLEGFGRSLAELARQVGALAAKAADEKPPEPAKDEPLAPWAQAMIAKVNALADSITNDPELVAGVRSKLLVKLGVKPSVNGAKRPFLTHDPDE